MAKYFTREEYTKGRDEKHPLTEEQESNMGELFKAMDQFREAYGKPLSISSGYRPAEINAAVGGAKKSNHVQCLAVDFVDKDGELAKFCLTHLRLLQTLGLYLEEPAFTKGWVHLQKKAPMSGNRVFKP